MASLLNSSFFTRSFTWSGPAPRQYSAHFSLNRIMPGVDNFHYDVHLSPIFRESVARIIFHLILKFSRADEDLDIEFDCDITKAAESDDLNDAVDYEALSKVGAIMGSGGLVVLDNTDCMVDISRYFLRFTQDQSCGKCTFCRIGTKRMLEIMDRICTGHGRQCGLWV